MVFEYEDDVVYEEEEQKQYNAKDHMQVDLDNMDDESEENYLHDYEVHR
jgi:hypothetical protein